MKREPVKAPNVYIRIAQQVCSDCGKVGCLIPVVHTEQRTGDETV
jgi:hypothetical protein